MGISFTVIIPVHNGAGHLENCLQALTGSGVPAGQVVVVDDCSSDSSAEVARAFGCTVLSTDTRSGPAHARNLGAHYASGDLLVFLDADVCVHGDTIARFLTLFEESPEVDAVIGSYDDSPGDPRLISRYRNLLHHYVHQNSKTEARTFWAGCGAIRRQVFLSHGGFSAEYRRPAIEDIELGYRLSAAGCRIVLDRNIRVKHLKRWSLWSMLKTDVMDRGIPWTELIVRQRNMPDDLNLRLSQRVSVGLVFLLMAIAVASAALHGGRFVLPLAFCLLLALSTSVVEFVVQPKRWSSILILGIHVAAVGIGGVVSGYWVLLPLLLVAWFLLAARHMYDFRNRHAKRIAGILWGAFAAACVVLPATLFPSHPTAWAFLCLLALLLILNMKFYLFLGKHMGWLQAAGAIPFHLLYFCYSGVALTAGLLRYVLGYSPQSSQRECMVSRDGLVP